MAALARLRVLVVDDHADTIDSTAILLTLDGHEVITAGDGATSIAKVVSHRPDLVFLDVGMPNMDGYEVARQIYRRPLSPKPYLCAVTGFATEADKRQCAEAGFDLHLRKPVFASVFRGLCDLLLLSRGIVARSPEIAEQNRAATTNLILQQLEMAHIFLDSSGLIEDDDPRARYLANARKAHDRVKTWLDGDACYDRRSTVIQMFGELRARLFP